MQPSARSKFQDYSCKCVIGKTSSNTQSIQIIEKTVHHPGENAIICSTSNEKDDNSFSSIRGWRAILAVSGLNKDVVIHGLDTQDHVESVDHPGDIAEYGQHQTDEELQLLTGRSQIGIQTDSTTMSGEKGMGRRKIDVRCSSRAWSRRREVGGGSRTGSLEPCSSIRPSSLFRSLR